VNTLIRRGVTGSEFMGRKHVKAAKRAPDAKLVAVAGDGRSNEPPGKAVRGHFSFCSQSLSKVYELFMNVLV